MFRLEAVRPSHRPYANPLRVAFTQLPVTNDQIMADQNSTDHTRDQSEFTGPLNRRSFLSRIALLGAAGLGGGSLLAACGGGEAESGGTEDGEAASGSTTAEADVQASECEGYDQLSEQALQQRETLGYVDETPDVNKVCTNCQFYKPTYELASGDSPCVGCQLFKGPVAPNGYCNSWVAKA